MIIKLKLLIYQAQLKEILMILKMIFLLFIIKEKVLLLVLKMNNYINLKLNV
jgi:hypothetical protein